MGQNSTKQRYTQLIEWLATRKTTTRKTVKTQDNTQPKDMGYGNVRIKNGPSGRR
jgi:hypothetical protein